MKWLVTTIALLAVILLLGGLDLGAALHPDRTGLLIGGEASVPYFDMNRALWGGLYVDTAYDTANSSTRLSLGPEFGWMYFGGDAGFVHQFNGDGAEGGSRNGIAVRPCLTIAIATLYFRHVEFLDDQPGSSINEFGLLIKYGFPINGHLPTLQ
jgi:hypothetical protein